MTSTGDFVGEQPHAVRAARFFNALKIHFGPRGPAAILNRASDVLSDDQAPTDGGNRFFNALKKCLGRQMEPRFAGPGPAFETPMDRIQTIFNG